MQFQRFDLNLLIALDVLLHERNVTRAAEKVFVSQPAMSAALGKLRDYFGDPLLVRVGRELELTPRGVSLIEPVREALLKIQATLGTQPSFLPATSQREFTMIISEGIVARVLPRLITSIASEAPGLRCHIELVSQNCLTKLEHGDADLCLILDHLKLYDAESYPDTLQSARLRPIEWVCAVDRNHPTIGDTLSAEQFNALPHVVGRPGGHASSGQELLRRLLDIDVPVQLTVPSLVHLPLVLAGTPFVATVPASVADIFLPLGQIKTFPLPFPAPVHHEILLWHKRHASDPAHQWLRALIVRLATED
jgi:DNA-binding transcriptional LysR family regulator